METKPIIIEPVIEPIIEPVIEPVKKETRGRPRIHPVKPPKGENQKRGRKPMSPEQRAVRIQEVKDYHKKYYQNNKAKYSHTKEYKSLNKKNIE